MAIKAPDFTVRLLCNKANCLQINFRELLQALVYQGPQNVLWSVWRICIKNNPGYIWRPIVPSFFYPHYYYTKGGCSYLNKCFIRYYNFQGGSIFRFQWTVWTPNLRPRLIINKYKDDMITYRHETLRRRWRGVVFN